MRQNDISDLEDCMYKIEALLKEYNCEILGDPEFPKSILLVDRDNNTFEYLVRGINS